MIWLMFGMPFFAIAETCPACELRSNTDPATNQAGSCGSCNGGTCKYPPPGTQSWWCPPCQIARKWQEKVGTEDCWKAVAIALGEGINPFVPATPLDATDPSHFCVDQVAWDQFDTLGPWQVKTTPINSAGGTGFTIDRRIEEATTYMRQCCGDGAGVTDEQKAWPAGQACYSHLECPNEIGHACQGPADVQARTPTTIFTSAASPPLLWCGANHESPAYGVPVATAATYGWTGRLWHGATYYSQHETVARQLCENFPGVPEGPSTYEGVPCHGDDCLSEAACPVGTSLIDCESEPANGGDGIQIESGKCIARGASAPSNRRRSRRRSRHTIQAIASCSSATTSVVVSSPIYLDNQDISAECATGNVLGCYCHSAWTSSVCGGTTEFAPTGSVCKKTIGGSSGRRRGAGAGAGAKVYALCGAARRLNGTAHLNQTILV